MPICFKLLLHLTFNAAARALPKAGRSMDARIAMIAITTNSSIKVNDFFMFFPFVNNVSYESSIARFVRQFLLQQKNLNLSIGLKKIFGKICTIIFIIIWFIVGQEFVKKAWDCNFSAFSFFSVTSYYSLNINNNLFLLQ